jgi:ADP-ribose pyrophosphatase YjhB (NUDIX family)
MAVLFREAKVLLIRRSKEPDAGRWSLPAGKIEAGESINDAAIRELAEETGISADAGGVITAVDAIDYGQDGALRFHFVIVAVSCYWKSGDPVAGDDAIDVGWFSPSELDTLVLASGFDVRAVVTQALSYGVGSQANFRS